MAKKPTKPNKAKDLIRVKELNEKDPTLSYKEIIKRLNIDISPSGMSRWVSELKKANQWKTPEDSKNKDANEIKKLANKITKLGESNNLTKEQMARKFRVGKAKIDKAIALIANNSEITAKSTDTISMTDNNVVSISPKRESSISEGGIYNFKTRPRSGGEGKQKKALVVSIQNTRVYYVEGESDTKNNELVKSAFVGKLSNCSMTTFKRRPKLTEIEVNELFLYAMGQVKKLADEAGKTVSITSGVMINGYVTTDRKMPTYEELISGYKDFIPEYNHGRREDLDSEEDDKGEIAAQEDDSIKKTSRVSKLTEQMKECPMRSVLTEDAITIYEGLEGFTVTSKDDRWNTCLDLIESKNWVELETTVKSKKLEALDLKEKYAQFGFTISGGYVVFGDGLGQMKFNGVEVLANRAEHYASIGDENGFERISRFIENMTMNPDPKVISRIVDFIKWADVEITDEGYLRVYKVVRKNYFDKHSGKVNNSVGSTVFMRRTLVDGNENRDCSHGLHVCSLNYFGAFSNSGDRLVACILHPEDIVSIPSDYKGSKIRCCRYVVEKDVTTDYIQGRLKADTKGEFSKKK